LPTFARDSTQQAGDRHQHLADERRDELLVESLGSLHDNVGDGGRVTSSELQVRRAPVLLVDRQPREVLFT